MTNDLTVYEPRNFGELEAFANRVVRTNLVPQAYRNKPDDAMVAMMFGKETGGLGPLTSLQFIAVINGRPGYYSDAVPGVALNKGLITDIEEYAEGTPYEDDYKRVCIVTKANGKKVTAEFSVADAKKAGLWGKQGPWTAFPKRMLQWRAKGYGVRDAAPHLLFGNTVEELRDLEEQPHIGPDRAKDISPRDAARASSPPPEDALLTDPDGEERAVAPGEVETMVKTWCGECTDEQLGWLVENNPGVPMVATLVEAEQAKRAAASSQSKQDDSDPLGIKGKSAKDAVRAIEDALADADAGAADGLWRIYRDKVRGISQEIHDRLESLVLDKIGGGGRLV